MKKKILLLMVGLMLFAAGVVSGSSMWGTYKGNEIIRLTVNGTAAKITDVPAINYNDRTMVPLYLLKQAGVNFSWDEKTRTVNIISSKSSTGTTHSSTTGNAATAPVIKSELHLYSNDGKTYLGKLTTNVYDKDSIYNEYGTYGSEYSATSIWNEYGIYGSEYSNTSAFNPYATKPPVIYENNKPINHLTKNSFLEYAIDPSDLHTILKAAGY